MSWAAATGDYRGIGHQNGTLPSSIRHRSADFSFSGS
jgi:hypothetical protein